MRRRDSKFHAEQRGLGLVFQSYAIWPHRSVFENVAYGLRVRRAPEAETRQKVGAVLERLGLGQLADRYAHQLSAASNSASPSHGRWFTIRRCCCSMNRYPILDAKLREDARAWIARDHQSRPKPARSMSPTIRRKRWRIADHVLCWTEDSSKKRARPKNLRRPDESSSALSSWAAITDLKERLRGSCPANAAGCEGEGWTLWGRLRAPKRPARQPRDLIRVERLRLSDGAGRRSFEDETAFGPLSRRALGISVSSRRIAYPCLGRRAFAGR